MTKQRKTRSDSKLGVLPPGVQEIVAEICREKGYEPAQAWVKKHYNRTVALSSLSEWFSRWQTQHGAEADKQLEAIERQLARHNEKLNQIIRLLKAKE